MSSQKTLYIHAGTDKTGSTSIQNLFYYYRDYFLKQGLYYPYTGNIRCHHDFVADFYEPRKLWKPVANYMEILKRDIAEKKPDKCLLSSEFFYRRLDNKEIAESIRQVFDGYAVRIIIYLRRADKLLPSTYKQHVMGFRYRVLDKFYRQIDYIEKLAGIKKAFGLDNADIIIRPFEKQQFHQNDLLKDILNVIGIEDPDDVTGNIKPVNVKKNLNLDIIEYVRQMSLSVNTLESSETLAWQKIFSDYPNPNEYEDISLFGSYENLEDTMNYYAPMYDYIAREYLGRQDGKLFYEDPPPDKEHFIPYPGLSIEKIAQINGYLNHKIRQEYMSQIKALHQWTLKGFLRKIVSKFQD